MDEYEIALVGPAAASYQLLMKLLGPTADYLGEGLKDWTAHRVENVQRITDRAAERLGEAALEEPGSVPPRVLKGIIEEGSFVEDPVTVEYLAGMLAGSRGSDELDDRAVSLVSQIGRLSTFQIRAHYALYASAQRLLAGATVEDIDFGLEETLNNRGRFFISLPDFFAVLGVEQGHETAPLIGHSLNGLIREGLLNPGHAVGNVPTLEKALKKQFPSAGIVYTLSPHGLELFCAAHNRHGVPKREFLESYEAFEFQPAIQLGENVQPVDSLPALAS